MTIGSKIKRLRVARKQTLKQLSDGIGISVSYLSDIERSYRGIKPSIEMLQGVARYFDMPVKSFFPSEWDWEPLEVSGEYK